MFNFEIFKFQGMFVMRMPVPEAVQKLLMEELSFIWRKHLMRIPVLQGCASLASPFQEKVAVQEGQDGKAGWLWGCSRGGGSTNGVAGAASTTQ